MNVAYSTLLKYQGMNWIDFMDNEEAVIAAERQGVYISYADTWVSANQCILLVGPSKVGKTSVLNRLSGRHPTEFRAEDTQTLLLEDRLYLVRRPSSSRFLVDILELLKPSPTLYPISYVIILLKENATENQESYNCAVDLMFHSGVGVQPTQARLKLASRLQEVLLIHEVRYYPTFEERILRIEEILGLNYK